MVHTSGSGVRLIWSESLAEPRLNCLSCLIALGLNSHVCKMGIIRACTSRGAVRFWRSDVCEVTSPEPALKCGSVT